ncbi:MAG: binary toxin-like calcium binding domain-containing protein [Patescibacteria group bacterium]
MPKGIAPTNLSIGEKETPQEAERIVPQRPIFPKKASEELPEKPQIDRFGQPSDVVPKQPVEKIIPPSKQTKEEKESVSFMPEEGLSPEKIARRETIKKSLIFIILVLLVVFGVVLTINRFLLSKKETATQTPSPISPPSKTTQQIIDESTDSDGDGMPDIWENEHKLDPRDPKDTDFDPDLDKLKNSEEYKYQTDPQNSDTDGDGYKDGDEVKNGYNPKGQGKLEETKTFEGEKKFSEIEGNWQGTMFGAFYQIKDLNLTIQTDGKVSGKFTSFYQQYRIQNEISGTYDFKKESGIFSVDSSGSAVFLGKIKDVSGEGLFSLTLEGKETKGEISGTWIISSKSQGLIWLKSDRGNLKIKKQ